MTPAAAYATLKQRFALIQQVYNTANILNRDMITAMPRGAGQDRTEQMVALSAIAHGLITATDMADLLADAESDLIPLSPFDRANLAEMRRLHTHAAGVPAELIAEAARLGTIGDQNHSAWKRAGDWDAVRPHYQATFNLYREIAAAKQAMLKTATPYDALIDEYDHGCGAERIESLFNPVEEFLRTAIPEAAARHPRQTLAPRPMPLVAQETILRQIATDLGFDFTRGNFHLIDQHPSCYGTPDDQRFTARARENDFADTLRTVAHEAGHGIYEQNLPLAWRYQPVGASNGMTLHESQSLFWEKQITRHPSFLPYLARVAARSFDGDTQNLMDPLAVAPGFIRVEADEMTYPMHIFLRFDLEKQLISGALSPLDIPEAWNEGMKSRLGITPPNHSQGCLQDIHWASGSIGYFPSYSLGAMTAAQIMAALQRDIPDCGDKIAQGDFTPLREWLTRHIHSRGSSLTPRELIRAATGSYLDPAYFISHLRQRYLE